MNWFGIRRVSLLFMCFFANKFQERMIVTHELILFGH